jgi:hypothetical protein
MPVESAVHGSLPKQRRIACLGMRKPAEGQYCVLIQLRIHVGYGLIAAHLALLKAPDIMLHVALPVLNCLNTTHNLQPAASNAESSGKIAIIATILAMRYRHWLKEADHDRRHTGEPGSCATCFTTLMRSCHLVVRMARWCSPSQIGAS